MRRKTAERRRREKEGTLGEKIRALFAWLRVEEEIKVTAKYLKRFLIYLLVFVFVFCFVVFFFFSF